MTTTFTQTVDPEFNQDPPPNGIEHADTDPPQGDDPPVTVATTPAQIRQRRARRVAAIVPPEPEPNEGPVDFDALKATFDSAREAANAAQETLRMAARAELDTARERVRYLEDLVGDFASARVSAPALPKRKPGRPAKAAAVTAASPKVGRPRGSKNKGADSDLLESVKILLRKSSKALRCEEIRERLGCDKEKLKKTLKAGKDSGTFKVRGQLRATTYEVA